MRALLLSPRFPGTGFTGDRVRAALHLDALREAGFEVTLVAGTRGGAAPALPPGVSRVVPVPLRAAAVPFALARLAADGGPLQAALFAGPWRAALAPLRAERFDVVSVLLVRTWPFVANALPAAPLVLDYVDALSAAAVRAGARERSLPRRLYWRLEAPRLAALERAAAGGASLLLATTPFDAAALPAGTRAIGNGVEPGDPPPSGARPPVVAFSGRLGYRPNVVAARRLVSGIWPRVRAEVPAARLAIGGADAPASLLRLAGRDGVSVTSPVADMGAFLRAARVAALPVELGTGTPNKLLEAFVAGTPAVATSELLARALDPPCAGALAADDDAAFAGALVHLLRDDAACARAGAEAREWAERHASRSAMVRRLAGWYREVAS